MHIWSYVGVISGMTLLFSALTLPSNKFQSKTAQKILVTISIVSLIVFAVAVIWPNISDATLYPESESLFSATSTNNQTSVALFKENGSGRYYVIGQNLGNLIVHTYRIYIDEETAASYISQYKALTAAQDELVETMNKVIPK